MERCRLASGGGEAALILEQYRLVNRKKTEHENKRGGASRSLGGKR